MLITTQLHRCGVRLQQLFIISFLLSAGATLHAQKDGFPDFGKADMKELLMKECDFDKNAPALKLMDYQEAEVLVDYDIRIRTERRVRIKIFNEKGFDFASITIPYYGRKRESKIKDISAYVYNLDSSGKVVVRKIEKKQMYREKAESGQHKVVFTFPDLRSGSVIEYRYTKIERNTLHFDPWFFQDRIPTVVSSCRITRPTMLPLDQRFITRDSVEQKREIKNYGYNRPSTTINSFTLKKIPAFRLEPMMSSIKDNLQRIEFALTPSILMSGPMSLPAFKNWNYFNRLLLRSSYFGKAINSNIPGTAAIIDTVKKIKDTAEKINYIYHAVKEKLKWDEEQTFYAEDINEAWTNGDASSAEMNIILLNLVRKAGIRAYPILVSTRDNGKTDNQFMTLSQFNGVDVIAMDSSNLYILDATQKYQSYKTPPYNILNRNGYLIDTLISQWVYITDKRPLFKNLMSGIATIDPDGKMNGDASSYYFDFAKSEKLTYKPEKDEEDEKKKFIEKEATDLKIDSVKEDNAEDETKALMDKFHFSGNISKTGDFYFVDPLFLSNFRKNPFVDSLRSTDIDFGSNQYYSISITLNIPEGFAVDHLPINQILRSADSSILFKRMYYHENNILVLRNVFEVLKPIYEKEEYPVLKEFFQRMYGMINEQIVLKKP